MHYVSGPGEKFSQWGCIWTEFVSNSACCATFRSYMLRHMLQHLQQNGTESELESGECCFKKKKPKQTQNKKSLQILMRVFHNNNTKKPKKRGFVCISCTCCVSNRLGGSWHDVLLMCITRVLQSWMDFWPFSKSKVNNHQSSATNSDRRAPHCPVFVLTHPQI